MDPLLDFMVQPTAIFVNRDQLELVLALLDEDVDPISIPEYVRLRVSGVDLKVEDIEAIRDGEFHVCGPDFHVRIASSGNLIASEVIDGFFQALPTVSSLHSLRDHIQREYGFVINDHDVLDIFDGSFHVAGPRMIDFSATGNVFVPRSVCSEAVWLYDRGCTSEFVSKYVWYRFHCQLPARVLVRLALAVAKDNTFKYPAVVAVVNSAPSVPVSKAPCLKQTPRRAPPPLPIITSGPIPISSKVQAVRLSGGTFTANPAVLCHLDDRTYTMVADFEGGTGSDCDCASSHVSNHLSDSVLCDSVPIHGDNETDSDSYLDFPNIDQNGLPSLPDPVQLAFSVPSTTATTEIDTDKIADEDLSLVEFETQDQGLPNLGTTTLRELELYGDDNVDSLVSSDETQCSFDQDPDADFVDALVDLERGSVHSDIILEVDLERGNPASDTMEDDLEPGNSPSDITMEADSADTMFDFADPAFDSANHSNHATPKKNKISSFFRCGVQ